MSAGNRAPEIDKLLMRRPLNGAVLEVGAGGGELGELFDHYVGVDLPDSPFLRPGGVQLFCDASRLPFRKAAFAMAFCKSSLYLTADPGQVCREIHYCLQPGGRFLVFDYGLGAKRLLLERHHAQGQTPTLHFWTTRQLRRLLLESGFSRVDPVEFTPFRAAVRLLTPWLAEQRFTWLMMEATKG